LASQDGKTHIAWGEATPPESDIPGVPAMVATYDHTTGTLGEPELIGYGPPPNDIHNTPSITIDSKGYLHVLTGTHGATFRYAQSLEPDDASGGFTDPKPVGEDLRQTYIGMVCDENDNLHLVFRIWRRDDGLYFPDGIYANLGYQTKPHDGDWSDVTILVAAAFSEYSIFYHRLTIDHTGDLYLSYDYWSTFWFYRTDHVGTRRKLMMSENGDIWRLVTEKGIVK
jgi:hypothetical protein